LIIDHKSGRSGIGASFLRQRTGPEDRLVTEFLRKLQLRNPFGWRATVFREPRLETGSPDVVIVQWSPVVARGWSRRRATLKREDIRLIHYLTLSGPKDEAAIRRVFLRGARAALARLEAADMVTMTGSQWRAHPLSRLYAARRIIAIEAKVKEPAAAIDQARLNTWFASHSYVLVPSIPSTRRILRAAAQLGIGVWVRDVLALRAKADAPLSRPRSMGSWLLNEWAWRASLRQVISR
jgi:hypothetical protein